MYLNLYSDVYIVLAWNMVPLCLLVFFKKLLNKVFILAKLSPSKPSVHMNEVVPPANHSCSILQADGHTTIELKEPFFQAMNQCMASASCVLKVVFSLMLAA